MAAAYPIHHRLNRRAVTAAVAACAVYGLSLPAAAQTRQDTTRWLVGFAAGGGTDVIARLLAEPMARRLGGTIVVDNRPGANGLLAMDELRRARPDGRTLLVSGTGTLVMLPHIQAVSFELKDFAVAGLVSRYPLVAVVPAATPARSLQEFVAFAKSMPGKLSYSSSGIGAADHFAGELFKQETGIDLVHVPFKSAAAALPDLLEGRTSLHLINIQVALPMIRAGRLVPLAVTGAARVPELPQVPTVAEAGFPTLAIAPWIALIGPAGLPADAVHRVNAALNQSLAEPAVRKRLAELGHEAIQSTPAEAQAHIQAESDRYRRVARAANIKAQ